MNSAHGTGHSCFIYDNYRNSILFSDILVYYVNKPFLDSGNKLNIFTLVGGFMLKFKVSAATALFILVPMIIFQIWRFIVPAIERKNRTFSRITIISAVLLFYSGAAFVFSYCSRQPLKLC
jgi:sec-independent protein translocase protein TatC